MIEINGLQKNIEGRLAVDIESFSVAHGEIAAVVGPAGSGKNVLLALLTGQARPTVGTVHLMGVNPQLEKRTLSQTVGVLFAQDGLYQRRSARSNLLFHCRLHRRPNSRADEILLQVGLADQAGTQTKDLSSGLARRLAFGRAIIHRPKVLLLADPFARCDESTIALLSRLIKDQATSNTSVLILATDDAHLKTLCDSIHTIKDGRIVHSYHPDEESPAGFPFKIPVKLEGKVALINPAEILYADVLEGRAYLHTVEDRLPTQFTLTELEERLLRSGFFRAHRGYLVNLQHVKEVIPYTRNSFSLRLDDAGSTKIPLSKTAAAELRELLGY